MIIRATVRSLMLRLIVACCIGTLAAAAHGQTTAEVQRKFTDLRNDKIPHNCSTAVLWLYARRDKLKDAMLDELYRTDRQGRDALLQVLFVTPSFVPDERFARFVVNRLTEEDQFVSNFDIAPQSVQSNDADTAPEHFGTFEGAHWAAFKFMDDHFEHFDTLLSGQVGAKRSLWALWGTTWLFQKRGVLKQHAALYTPEVLAWVADNLQNDAVRFNASHAARIFLLLGDASLPTLRQSAAVADPQARNLARALIDALNGNHRAFGYLVARLNLTRTVFGRPPNSPNWLNAEAQPYYNNEKDYP